MVPLGLLVTLTANAVFPVRSGVMRLPTLVVALSLLVCISSYSIGLPSVGLYHGYLQISSVITGLVSLCLIITLVACQLQDRSIPAEYGHLILCSLLGSQVLLSSCHSLSLVVSLELQSFGAYTLAALSDRSARSTSAGLKYLLLGGLASSLVVFGVAVSYSATGQLYDTGVLLAGGSSVGSLLLLTGLVFKLGGAPFHQWSPDVYGWITTGAMSYLSLVPKVAVYGLLWHLSSVSSHPAVLVIIGASLVVGSLGGIVQTDVRRLLAYSSIAHVGFVLLCLVSGTTESLLFYVWQYGISSALCFLVLSTLVQSGPITLTRLSGLWETHPYSSLVLSLCLFSLAGVPPLVGFYAKLGVLYGSIGSGYHFLTVLAIVSSVLSGYFYLRLVVVMHSARSLSNYPSLVLYPQCSPIVSYLTSMFTLLLVIYSLDSGLLDQSAQLMAQQRDWLCRCCRICYCSLS